MPWPQIPQPSHPLGRKGLLQRGRECFEGLGKQRPLELRGAVAEAWLGASLLVQDEEDMRSPAPLGSHALRAILSVEFTA